MKKSAIFISVFLFILTFVRAAYLEKLPYTITQPDGETINCFVSGDEFFNWIHDDEGYAIIQAPDGYYYYAEQVGDIFQPSKYLVNSVNPASVGLRKGVTISKTEYQRRYDAIAGYETTGKTGTSTAPHSGTINNLVIYIRFWDDDEFTVTRQEYDDKFNPETGVALKSYFKEVSYGNLIISSTHYPACALTTNLSYRDSHTRNYFQPYNETTNPAGYTSGERGTRERTLLEDAINWINVNSPVPASLNIDGDGDNIADNVCFIVRGNCGGWSELLWGHAESLFSQNALINGKTVGNYTFQPENQVMVYILCHEMFHVLGAPDLYHFSNHALIPVGYWDLMDQGYGHMLAFMKWQYSNHTWISTVPEITAAGTYTLNPLTSSTNNCYRIASPYSTDEYFMVEYRNKSGTFESQTAGPGLIVYRIDTRYWGNGNGPPDGVYLYRQGGTPTLNGYMNNSFFSSAVGRTAINDTTNPGCFLQTGSAGGLNISNVTAPGTTISFDVTFPPPTIQASAFTSSALTDNSMTASWTRGNGNAVMVVARAGSAVNANPVNGTAYTANAAFGSGTQMGTGNFVVYNGTGTSVNLTALTSGTDYYFAIYEYFSAHKKYLVPALTGNATTELPSYCAAGSSATDYEYISNVAIGSINQASGIGNAGYQDFTSQITTMQIGVYDSATICVSDPSKYDQLIIWVDWNKDHDFIDADENVYSSGGYFNSPHTTANFAPPFNATIGTTRMRIRLHFALSGRNSTPCGDAAYGEVEDYTIHITAAPCNPPIIGTITQPTCAIATGSVVLNNLPASGTWIINPGSITGTGTSTTLSGLADGTYAYTVTNEAGCTSVSSVEIVINAQPETPAAPTVDTIIQPTCTEATGSVVLHDLPASGTWIVNPGSITGTGTSTTLSELAAGTYAYTVTNAAGCASDSSAEVVINIQPQIATPMITLNGNILHSDAPDSNQWYNQNGLIQGATNQDYTVISNGVYYVIVTLDGCISDLSNSINVVLSGNNEIAENDRELRVYPNPVSGELIIEIEGNGERLNYEILNSGGQIVFKGNVLEEARIQTTTFTPGIYLLKLETSMTIILKKIVKE